MVKIENQKDSLFEVYEYLPKRLESALRLFCLKYPKISEIVTEIRLRENGAFSLSVDEKNIFISETGQIGEYKIICTSNELAECVSRLCVNSYQSHEEEIESGYISLKAGLRAGVAVSSSVGGKVYGINSVCIRIPHEIEADCSELFKDGLSSMLIFSPPAVGKTTLLRLVIRKLCNDSYRVAVIDTRGELREKNPPHLVDYICGLKRHRGIEHATRTLSPQVIVCDEIGSKDDAEAILSTQNTGVPLIATAHSSSAEQLLKRPNIKLLYDSGVFDKLVKLSRDGGEFIYEIAK